MQVLSEELFGRTIPVCDFPRLKGICGIGMSDSADYAGVLADRFDYRNTWYHRDPQFDITDIDDAEWGQYDFVLSSEVLEHVAPPVEQAFSSLCRLLKPDGMLVMSVPFLNSPETREHFPELNEFTIAALADRLVLVNRTRDGRIEVHEDLLFHGGPGSTLELRLFSDRHLRQCLLDAGFSGVHFYPGPAPKWGIVHPGEWSLPLAARKESFSLRKSCTSDWTEQWEATLARNRAQEHVLRTAAEHAVQLDADLVARTEWAQRLDAELEAANERLHSLHADVEARTAWARDLERQLAERTEWALSLQRELEEHVRVAHELQTEAEGLRRELEAARQRFAALEQSRAVRLGRKLRLA
jgi:SAM-dependent methyltransferase